MRKETASRSVQQDTAIEPEGRPEKAMSENIDGAGRRSPGLRLLVRPLLLAEVRHVDEFASMSDEELEAYVNDRSIDH